MRDYEQWERGDPFEVAARREAVAQRKERECGQCIHKRIQSGKNGEIEWKCVFSKRRYGHKCELFKSGDA